MAIELILDDTLSVEKAATPWAAVICLSLLTFLLVGLEFLPVSLLTPIAQDLAVSEGQAGQAIAVSGLFAVITSLFGNTLLAKLDRRTVVLLYTAVLAASSLAVALAPSFSVFLVGRALVGIAIGGFWSLSTAILARLASEAELSKAIALLQGGTAFAIVIAAPLGSFLGELIGWRGTFFVTVPIGLAALIWQLAVLPKMPPMEVVSVSSMFRLLRNRTFAIGMAATGLAFIGMNSLSIYLRPFLENVTGLEVNALTLVLLGVGLGGLAGLSIVGFALRRNLTAVLIGLPSALALLALLLIAVGSGFLGHGRASGSLGAVQHPDSSGVEYMDGQGHSRRPRSRRRAASGADPVRHRRRRVRGRHAVRRGRLVERFPARRRVAGGVGPARRGQPSYLSL
jgi:predicted MFS family arabinose efflux permease